MTLLLFIFILSLFLGWEITRKTPSRMHAPLLSGTVALTGITAASGILALGGSSGGFLTVMFGFFAVTLAAVNAAGGGTATDRLLKKYRQKKERRR